MDEHRPLTHEDVARAYAEHNQWLLQRLQRKFPRIPRDTLEDALLAAWTRLLDQVERRRPAPDSSRAWMATTSERETLRLLERTRSHQAYDDADEETAAAPSTVQRAAARLELADLDHAHSRDARVLRAHAAGWTYEEIGRSLGISRNRTYKLAERARRALRARVWQ